MLEYRTGTIATLSRACLGLVLVAACSGDSGDDSDASFTASQTATATATTTTDATTTDATTTDATTSGTATDGTSVGTTTDPTGETSTTGDPDPVCGNGEVEGDEACDDGNDVDTDECPSTCQLAACGDGFVQADVEECDDGNDLNTDACTAECLNAACGDGYLQEGVEGCDDGNDDNEDLCTNECISAACGDAIVQEGEGCDDGNDDDTDECTSLCQPATCGDGFVQVDVEECDDSGESEVCNDDCTPAACGDAKVNMTAMEECDDGNDDDADECTGLCLLPVCGDGFVQEGEECDDGNMEAGDGCSAECTSEFCFQLKNDGGENLNNNTWFDDCVAAAGSKVTVRLLDANNNEVYKASGNKVGVWTNDKITSDTNSGSQYHSNNHNRIISLDNGDKLMIPGRWSSNGGCGGSFGNGYGIVIYPANPNYYSNPKMVVLPYRHQVGNNNPRSFNGWSQSTEINWNNGNSFNTCNNGAHGFTGTFEFSVGN